MASPPVPFAVVAALFAQAAPAVALLPRRNPSRPVRLIALSLILTLFGDFLGHYVGRITGNSLWVNSGTELVIGPLTLWGVAEWQVTYIERLMVRISVVPFLLIYGGLLFFVEDLSTFPKYTSPFLAILILGASSWTLLRRAMTNIENPLLRTDWFYVLGGLALGSATTAVSTPVGAILVAQNRMDLMIQVWTWRSIFVLLGLLAITIGTLTPPAPESTA